MRSNKIHPFLKEFYFKQAFLWQCPYNFKMVVIDSTGNKNNISRKFRTKFMGLFNENDFYKDRFFFLNKPFLNKQLFTFLIVVNKKIHKELSKKEISGCKVDLNATALAHSIFLPSYLKEVGRQLGDIPSPNSETNERLKISFKALLGDIGLHIRQVIGQVKRFEKEP